MKIITCNEVPFDDVFEAFSGGFSDYMIQFEMAKDQFKSHFFGPEANKLIFSYIAYVDEKPAGLILGGCKNFDGVLTLRCGTMCVVPEYRGQGLARKLLEKHEKLALDLECKNLFLECINGNDRAFHFYLTSGYKVVYQLKYYTHKKYKKLESETELGNLVDYTNYRNEVEGHVNWQNEIWSLEKSDPTIHLVKHQNHIVGMLAARENRICYLHIKKQYRGKGYGKKLLFSLENREVKISFPSHSGLEMFLMSQGFVEDEISQFEMYKMIAQK